MTVVSGSGGKDQVAGRVMGELLPIASQPGPILVSPVFTAPAESEGSGPEERSPGQQVSPRWRGAPDVGAKGAITSPYHWSIGQ